MNFKKSFNFLKSLPPKLKDFYFRQLKWLDASDEALEEPEGATVVGKRLKYIPNQYDPNVT